MNGAALAAVVAAAVRLLARKRTTLQAATGTRWDLAERLATPDAAHARLVAHARSRWSMSGRLRD